MLVVLLPFLVHDRVAEAIGDIAAADGRFLAVAAACFVAVIVATARAWCSSCAWSSAVPPPADA